MNQTMKTDHKSVPNVIHNNLNFTQTDDKNNSPDNSGDHLNISTSCSYSTDELNDEQAEDALSNLHNLLYLQSPNIPAVDPDNNLEVEGGVIPDKTEDEQDNDVPLGR